MSFLNSKKIINQFNISVENFNKSIAAEKLDALDKSREFRDYSANSVYKSLEWALKRHISIYYDTQFSNGRISSVTRDGHKSVLNKPDANIVFLINEVKKTEINSIVLTNIDFELIQTMKKQVRNGPEHSATEISTNKLKKVINEVRKVIKNLVDNNVKLNEIDEVNENCTNINTFDELFIACDRFDTKNNIYVMAIGNTDFCSLSSLTKIPWSLIIDFNSESKNSGLFHEYEKEFSLSPHYITIHQARDYEFSKSSVLPYYFFGNGDVNIKDTLVTDLKDWRRKYTPALTLLLSSFAEIYDRNIKVIISHENYTQIEILCQQFDIAYNDRVQFIITSKNKGDFDELINSYNVVHIPVKVSEFCLGIESYRSYFENRQLKVGGTIIIPGKDGLTKYSSEQYGMMNEDFEIVHNEIALLEIEENETLQTPVDFYKGEQISWYGLQDHFDIERNKTKNLLNTVRQYLKTNDNNITTLIKILHDPGVGGTTILRRIAWELHDDNPTIILKQFREGATLANINKLYHLTNRPLLVLAEANEISSDIIVKLFNSVKRSTIPAVFIMLQRGNAITETDTTKYINYLNDNELRFSSKI
ncbi:P-loop NTPase [Paenibacillus elgii]|uniref:P-loop NTPase n=1 Tax=Paenibacillus elgii TaxID=189691 RepID=UPI0013D3A2B4|nr:hypothetical protein [Paenibacillus elgii]